MIFLLQFGVNKHLTCKFFKDLKLQTFFGLTCAYLFQIALEIM